VREPGGGVGVERSMPERAEGTVNPIDRPIRPRA
jgi:hypothetical protein